MNMMRRLALQLLYCPNEIYYKVGLNRAQARLKYSARKLDSIQPYCKALFQTFDKNSDGYISLAELKKSAEFGDPEIRKDGRIDKIVADLIKELDTNHDGRISYEEFESKLYDPDPN